MLDYYRIILTFNTAVAAGGHAYPTRAPDAYPTGASAYSTRAPDAYPSGAPDAYPTRAPDAYPTGAPDVPRLLWEFILTVV